MAKKGIEKQVTSLSKVFYTLAALLITIIGIRYIAQDLIAPILFALFFTVLMYPVFRWFRRKGFGSVVSLILMILTFFVAIFLLVVFFTWSFGLINESLAAYTADFKTTFSQITQDMNLDSSTEAVTQELIPETINSVMANIFSQLSGFVYYFIFIPILSFMILLQIDSLPREISQKLLMDNPSLKRLEKFAQSITIYVTGRFKVNLITGLLFSLSLILIGIDFPFVWGLLTVILSFIPYAGLIIAGIPPVFLALASGEINSAIFVVGALVIVNLFAENVAEPYIQGRSNKVSMATVVISLIFWTWLLGFVGAIMAVPLTVLLKTILADYQETRWMAAIMEGHYVAPTEKAGKQNRVAQFFRKILPRGAKT